MVAERSFRTFRALAGRGVERLVVCFNSRPMPKMKTHSGTKKRFRATATGKLRGRRAYSSHILEKKSPKRKRRMGLPTEVSGPDRKRVRTLLAPRKR